MKPNGYGMIAEGGTGGKLLQAHRVAYEVQRGPAPGVHRERCKPPLPPRGRRDRERLGPTAVWAQAERPLPCAGAPSHCPEELRLTEEQCHAIQTLVQRLVDGTTYYTITSDPSYTITSNPSGSLNLTDMRRDR